MPEGLDIDHDTPMTFSPYREHIVICTGRSDWSSKIELDPHTSPLTRHVKGLLGPKARRGQTSADEIVPGKYHNVSLAVEVARRADFFVSWILS